MVQENRKKVYTTLLILMLVISVFSHVFLFGPIVIIGSAADDSESYYNSTTLNVTVLQDQPRVNWYDFQYNNSGSWESRLNQQIDVNDSAEYRFIVNISSDQKWANIRFINITAWHDNGSEATVYNQTGAANNHGGNRNLFLQYENTTATGNIATWRLIWPDDEVTDVPGDSTETVVTDPDGSPGYTEARNITFAFIPGYQMRYAPDPTDTTAGHNDTWSWNFNITVVDNESNYNYENPTVGESVNEFGVYSYTEIVSAGWPVVIGAPGGIRYNESYIPIQTRSNGNYSLSVNVTNLTHKTQPSYFIQNTSIYTAGGELSTLTNFTGLAPQYYYNGSGAGYTTSEVNGTSLTTNDIEWAVNITMGQFPGDYEATIFYTLLTQTG